MYLKSLTLRGFKSFASATSLTFEPGITAVVGPNGSGKSNVVDAISWVMGEQGVKSLRGGKMEDVIFAGTSGRAPLGRAEVSLTIDNTDGALPIDYTEVTITRTMFRNGGSDYAINGHGCRLLDIQELLSDSGIGREMHVIVGQGQLDTILRATPEERRGFVEEAAGVLKHRRRKEKALRKLDAMGTNLTRLQDLTGELRRQLKPLGRQAELARRAQVIQADLRDARLRLLADDVQTWREAMAKEEADETAVRQRQADVDAALTEAQDREGQLEQDVVTTAPELARLHEADVALSGLRERFAGMRSVAAERVRHRDDTVAGGEAGPDPQELLDQAHAQRSEAAEISRELADHNQTLTSATATRSQAERAIAAAQQSAAEVQRARARRRESLMRVRGQVAAAQSRLETRQSEIARLQHVRTDALGRAAQAQTAYLELENTISHLDEGEQGLDRRFEVAHEHLTAVDLALAAATRAEVAAKQDRAALQARVEALEAGLTSRDGSAVLLAADSEISGVLGTVAALVTVQPGFEVAIGAALGAMSDAVAVADVPAALHAIQVLADSAAGRAHVLIGTQPPDDDAWPVLPAGAQYAIDLVHAPEPLRQALARLLRKVAVVADVDSAAAVIAQVDVVAVTRSGDVVSRGMAVGGRAESLLEVQAALAAAQADLLAAEHAVQAAVFDVASCRAQREEAQSELDAALSQLHESDAAMSAVAEQLGTLGSAVRTATSEAERVERAAAAATAAAVDDQATLDRLQDELTRLEAEPEPELPTTDDVPRLRSELEAARAAEVDARLEVRSAEERLTHVQQRAAELQATAVALRGRRERAAQARARQEQEAAVAADVLAALDEIEPMIAHVLQSAQQRRASAEQARTARDAELQALRTSIRAFQTEAAQLSNAVHRDELAKAEQRLRIDAAEEKALAEYGVDAAILVAEYGPDQLIPPSATPVADVEDQPAVEVESESEPAAGVPYRREQQESRARKAERELAQLGRVNPLALEEFAAMQERQAFLTEQLEDLKKGRSDLLGIITDVDDRVREVFAAAYVDVEREFAAVFARLFPGGEGRLVLTDPNDMLTTGIEVEARPPGKRIKRLSLLSGGERSLTSVAFLVALFRARPSPFYLLDEVEAALDDVNLGRLLDILEELRSTSQLLIITHQKRTMEIADALYGVTMRDGVTQVISQRLRESGEAVGTAAGDAQRR